MQKHLVYLVKCPPALTDILITELAEAGFDSFLETPEGFEASAPLAPATAEDAVNYLLAEETLANYSRQHTELKWEQQELEQQNWNKLWESNYPMVEVSDELIVRAAFHQPEKQYTYELIVTPRMSFGTGHHATTLQVMQAQLEIGKLPAGARVLDVGCGTGVLGILAAKMGATEVDACEIEDWTVENARENAAENGVEINVQLGSIEELNFQKSYFLILANINRYILLKQVANYKNLLAEGGYLITSGYRTDDAAVIEKAFVAAGLALVDTKQKEGWLCQTYRPNTTGNANITANTGYAE